MSCKGEIVAGVYKWEINNYNQYQSYRIGSFVESPEFIIGAYSWYMRLYPRGHKESEKIKDSLSVHSRTQNEKVMASYTFSIVNSERKVLFQSTSNEKRDFRSESRVLTNMIAKSIEKELEILSERRNFIILCEIVIDTSNVYNKVISYQSRRLEQFDKFEHLINNDEFSDVKFLVEGKSLHAHKNILALSSEVFAAMFKHKMKESEENVVEIEDLSYEVLYELFRFMYSGRIPRINELDKELFIAADKYQLSELKSICEQHLCDDLTINNAISYLHLSDIYGAGKLKEKAIDFIVINGKEMIGLKEFDSIMNLDVGVVKDIFRKLFFRGEKLSA